MSQRWDQVEERLDDYESQLDTVYRLYHIPVLAALMAFMLWIRVQHYERYLTDDGILLGGNDAWYHYRTTNYAVENFPFNLGFDPWTGFDTGTAAGQFGTLFDQIIAFVALIVGLGNPSQSTVDMTFLLAPAVFAAACAIPVFYVGKRLGGRFGGLIAVLVLAMTPGAFLQRSVVGFTDHHVAETLFQALSLLGVMIMVTVAQREKPIYELVEARDFDALRRPAIWGAVAGVAISLHIWVWPPAVFFLGLFAIFLFVLLSLDYVRGHSPDHVAIPSVIALLVVTLLTGLKVTTFELSATDFSILQPLMAILVAGGALFMAAVARLWDGTDLPRYGYPLAVVATGGVVALLVAVISPTTFDFFLTQATRAAGLTATDTAQTVAEVSSPWSLQNTDGPIDFFSDSYNLAFYTAIVGFGLLVFRIVTAKRPRGEQVLVVVWSAFVLLMTLTQVRFDYYFVIAIAAANAFLVREIYRFVDLDDVRRDVTNVKPYQVLIVVAIVFVIAGPALVAGAPMQTADQGSYPGESQFWDGSLDWMNENTPAPGAYGSGDEPRLEYYGAYDQTEDFEYQDGEYGVMSWWDYGHFITTEAERIPVANPFQQHASEAADFLLADDEQEALDTLQNNSGEGAGVPYVVVDYQLGYAGTQKYGAPAAWETQHDVSRGDLGVTAYSQQGETVGVHPQRGYESMRVRLYQFHGSARDPANFVTRFGGYNAEAGVASVPEEGGLVEQYNSSEEARQAAEQDPNAIHGGLAGQPSERVEALQHFRLVHASQLTTANLRVDLPGGAESWVKTFERVEGATIQGTGPADSEVQATVQMEVNSTGQQFQYKQYAQTDENGNFEMVVPYSTTGYDEYGTDAGYTNVDVRSNGSYQFVATDSAEATAWGGTADVTEGQVLGEEEGPVQVELEEGEAPEGAQGSGSGNETGGSTGDGSGDGSTNGSTGGENSTQDSENTSNDQQRIAARSP